MNDVRYGNRFYEEPTPFTIKGFEFDFNYFDIIPLSSDFYTYEKTFFNLPIGLGFLKSYQNYNFSFFSYYLEETDLFPHNLYEKDVYSYSPTYLTSVCSMTDTKTTSSPSSTIFNSNYRDKFLNEFHLSMAEQKLHCISDNSSKIILKKSFDYIKSICNIVYELSIFSNSLRGFEGFIDKHTYFSCSHSIKENKYYLNSFFSYNESICKEILNNIEIAPEEAKVSWVTNVSSQGLEIEDLPVEVPKPIFNSFYPWLNGYDLNSFLKNFLESQESILVLYGDPGTGKSNFLKYLLHEFNLSALITYQDSIRDLDIMFSHFLKGDNKLLIIEDADEFLTKRESGNTSMKRLLNITDGLTSNKDKKVIFTTNLTNTNSIDSALLREGRCFGAFRFEALNKEQSRQVAIDLEIEQNLLTKDQYTLAELFSIKNNKLKLIKGSSVKAFGFST